jgi:hypothetical protein
VQIEDAKQIALQNGQFAWCRNDKDGKLNLYVGPVRLTPTEDDIFLKTDSKNLGKFVPVSYLYEAVQDFVTIHDGEYAIVHNPSINATKDYPNGKYSSDKNSLEALDYGKSRVLTAGHFPVWPGQIVEIRPVHELESNEYLIVRVVDAERVDKEAPFYGVTLDCASIAAAVVDTTEQAPPPKSEGEKGTTVPAEEGDATGDGEAKPGGESAKTGPTAGQAGGGTGTNEPAAPAKGDSKKPPARNLQTGQRIVIPGSKTPIYIPPSGIEIIPDTSIDDSGRPITQNRARVLLETYERGKKGSEGGAPERPSMRGGPSAMPADIDKESLSILIKGAVDKGTLNRKSFSSVLQPKTYGDFSNQVDVYKMKLDSTESTAVKKAIDSLPTDALLRTAQVANLFVEPEIDYDKETIGGAAVDELKEIAEGPRLVRQAVVLGPTEFCVLLDVDGRPQIHRGPGRVFPGPYDRFQTEGSHRRVYNAYHLRSDRGLLLRIIAEKISKADLAKQLPPGLPVKVGDETILDKEGYLKGDEVFIGGFDAYLVPSNSFEVIHPEKRTPHIGNDHRAIYVQAIGVDQKSGVYVENVKTGQIDLVKGEKSLLLDPRKRRHTKRRVPGRAWNLMIGRAEPHKQVSDGSFVETPWALSVIIPNNEAVLVTSKSGRRVVEGPCTELLGYEEWLEKLTLSTGRPKSEDRKVETCFLKVRGNRVTDRIELVTKDFVNISVDVAYGVTFVGENQDDKAQWFDHRNYVRLLYTHLRSLLRNAARKKTLIDLQPIISDFVRDNVLGEKKEDEVRRGRHLDNNMLVDEVEVLDIDISDSSVAATLQNAQSEAVVRQIKDVTEEGRLESERKQDEIDKQRHELRLAEIEREKTLALRKQTADYETKASSQKLQQQYQEAAEAGKQTVADLIQQADIERQKAKTEADLELNKARADLIQNQKKAEADLDNEIRAAKDELVTKFKQAVAEIQKGLTTVEAEAMEKQLKAIQPTLIAAIEGLGDKQVLAELAKNLPEAGGALGFLTGLGGVAGFKALLKGVGLDKVLDQIELKRMSKESGSASSAETK